MYISGNLLGFWLEKKIKVCANSSSVAGSTIFRCSDLQFFSLYLIGNSGCLVDIVNQSIMRILFLQIIEFIHRFAESINKGVKFTSTQYSNKVFQFTQLVQLQSTKPHYQQILLEVISKNLQTVRLLLI